MVAREPVLVRLWREELSGYSWSHFRLDLLAGLTVAAVALPLALAFGVASGSTAAAGLVTAIVGGMLIGVLGGAPYQISGPTGAMSAILIVIAQQHGIQGVWIAGVMAGLIILGLGLFRLGRVVNYIPIPVIAGFTSGIALIIAIGQVDNALGITTPSEESSALKAIGYFREPLPAVNMQAVIAAGLVMSVMIALPRVGLGTRLPAALAGIALATVAASFGGWDVATIGAIPRTIVLDDRLGFELPSMTLINSLIAPAAAIAALGAIESLLAGVVAGRMTGRKLEVNQELVAQGVGNIVLPFIGGVPATAAIARISVGVKAGGVTRLVSIIHSLALLVSALLLGGLIARIPLAALAGVLLVTAWRMNEWHVIRFYVHRRLVSPLLVMAATMAATVALDLTQAILIGIAVSLLIFLAQVSRLTIDHRPVDWDRLRSAGLRITREIPGMRVVYVSGTLFFGAVSQFTDAIERLPHSDVLILSMRGVSMADVSCVHALEHLWEEQRKHDGRLLISGLQPQVQSVLERSGLVDAIGHDNFFWSADQAILAAASGLDAAAHDQSGHPLDSELEAGLDELPLGVVPVQ